MSQGISSFCSAGGQGSELNNNLLSSLSSLLIIFVFVIFQRSTIRIFTTHKRSLRRLCFYTCLSCILFTGGLACMARGGCAWPGGMRGRGMGGMRAMHAPLPPQPDTTRYGRSMSGRYASYWNAFLFKRANTIFCACKAKVNLILNCVHVNLFVSFISSTWNITLPNLPKLFCRKNTESCGSGGSLTDSFSPSANQ